MSKRQALGAKTRFEVFKRDSFTCTYCGAKAPDVLLHVDHILPVAEGGTNELINLATSCQKCNAGKGARKLDDNSVVASQKVQLEILQERHQQVKMMIEWASSFKKEEDIEVEEYEDYVTQMLSDDDNQFSFNDTFKREMKNLLKKYDIIKAIDAFHIALDKFDPDDYPKRISYAGDVLGFIPKALHFKYGTSEEEKKLYYIRGILNNRLHYINRNYCLSLLKEAYALGLELDDMENLAKTARNWTTFKETMVSMIQEQKNSNGQEQKNSNGATSQWI